MSIQGDIRTALASVASGRVYADAAPDNAPLPLVVYRRTGHFPEMTLNGYAGLTRSAFVFEAWAATKDGAVALAGEVVTAIDAGAGLTIKYREPADADEYESSTDQYVDLVAYSFWHA